MALHTLKIVVVDGGRASNYSAGGGGSSATGGASKKVDKNSPLYKLLHVRERIQEKIKSTMTPATAYAAGTFTNLAVQTAKSAFSYYSSDIGRSSGDSNYQARVNRGFAIGGQVLGVLGSTMSGATAGFMATAGNPIGAAVGAVVGLASSAMSLGFQYAEKARAYNHTMAEEKVGIEYNIGRMTGGTGIRLR